jgi:hypothetical protein
MSNNGNPLTLVMALLQSRKKSNHACYEGGKWTGNSDHYLEGKKDEGKEISFQNFVQHYNVLLDEQFY